MGFFVPVLVGFVLADAVPRMSLLGFFGLVGFFALVFFFSFLFIFWDCSMRLFRLHVLDDFVSLIWSEKNGFCFWGPVFGLC